MTTSISFVVFAVSCVQIYQKELIAKYNQFYHLLKNSKKFKLNLNQIWQQYLSYQKRICAINYQLNVFSSFWTFYLSATFCVYIHYQCNVATMILFNKTMANVAIRSIFILFLLETITLFFGLIEYCSRVVKNNQKLRKINYRLYLIFSHRACFSKYHILNILNVTNNENKGDASGSDDGQQKGFSNKQLVYKIAFVNLLKVIFYFVKKYIL